MRWWFKELGRASVFLCKVDFLVVSVCLHQVKSYVVHAETIGTTYSLGNQSMKLWRFFMYCCNYFWSVNSLSYRLEIRFQHKKSLRWPTTCPSRQGFTAFSDMLDQLPFVGRFHGNQIEMLVSTSAGAHALTPGLWISACSFALSCKTQLQLWLLTVPSL